VVVVVAPPSVTSYLFLYGYKNSLSTKTGGYSFRTGKKRMIP
jgi:hypothetical protein